VKTYRFSETSKLAAIFLISYISILAALYFLPKHTSAHHWIIGTPFQYMALALSASLTSKNSKISASINPSLRKAMISAVCLMIVLRVINLCSTEKVLLDRKASAKWDRSFTELAEFANSVNNNALFIASSWGYATQIYCLTQGNNDIIHETWLDYPGKASIQNLINKNSNAVIYVIAGSEEIPDWPNKTKETLDDVRSIPGIVPDPLEPVSYRFKCTRLYKFVHR
jgi:hypothetical protein